MSEAITRPGPPGKAHGETHLLIYYEHGILRKNLGKKLNSLIVLPSGVKIVRCQGYMSYHKFKPVYDEFRFPNKPSFSPYVHVYKESGKDGWW